MSSRITAQSPAAAIEKDAIMATVRRGAADHQAIAQLLQMAKDGQVSALAVAFGIFVRSRG